MRVAVIAVPGLFDSALTSMLDVLDSAEHLRPMLDDQIPRIETVIAGVDPTVTTARGLIVPVEHRLLDTGLESFDLVVVPAIGILDAAEIDDALARPSTVHIRELLRALGTDSRPQLAGACSGTFLLAEAGCLEGHRATTSWWLSGAFGRRYPTVELDMSRMVVESGTILTAGAAFAHIDLAINVVSHLSPRLAELVAARLLIDERPSRSAAAALTHLARSDQLVAAFEDWARIHLAEPINLGVASRAIGTTRRTLERRTRERLGLSPLQLVQRLRIERAHHLRRTTELSLGQIAHAVGYRNAATLSRLLRAQEAARDERIPAG